MIVVDANLLIYAHNRTGPTFDAAHEWLQTVMSSDEPVGLPWAVIHAFLRVTTASKVMPQPLPMSTATAVVDRWLAAPNVSILEPGPSYWRVFRDALITARVQGAMVTDGHLAALAIENDATMYTTDSDFRRFAGLRVINPLA